jgi:hypothetical protein
MRTENISAAGWFACCLEALLFFLQSPVRVSDANGTVAAYRYNLIKQRTLLMFTLAWKKDAP